MAKGLLATQESDQRRLAALRSEQAARAALRSAEASNAEASHREQQALREAAFAKEETPYAYMNFSMGPPQPGLVQTPKNPGLMGRPQYQSSDLPSGMTPLDVQEMLDYQRQAGTQEITAVPYNVGFRPGQPPTLLNQQQMPGARLPRSLVQSSAAQLIGATPPTLPGNQQISIPGASPRPEFSADMLRGTQPIDSGQGRFNKNIPNQFGRSASPPMSIPRQQPTLSGKTLQPLSDYARLEPEPTDTNLTSGMEHSDFLKQMQDYEKLSGGQQTHSSVSPQPASQPTKTQPPKVGWPEFDVEYITGKNGKPARSGATLDSLHPYMKEKMERIRDLAFDKHGLKMIFISGHRNEAQQKKKFDSRTSRAKFGGSSHSYGHGVDFYFQGDAEAMYRKRRRMKDDDGKWTGKLLPYNKAGEGELTKFTDPEDFQKVATIAAGEGLEWGGSEGVGTAGDFGHLGPVGFSGYGKAAQQQMQSPGMDKQLYSQIMSEQMIADDQGRTAKDLGFPPAK